MCWLEWRNFIQPSLLKMMSLRMWEIHVFFNNMYFSAAQFKSSLEEIYILYPIVNMIIWQGVFQGDKFTHLWNLGPNKDSEGLTRISGISDSNFREWESGCGFGCPGLVGHGPQVACMLIYMYISININILYLYYKSVSIKTNIIFHICVCKK